MGTKNEWFGADRAMTYAAFGCIGIVEDEDLTHSPMSTIMNLTIARKGFRTVAAPTKGDTGPRVASAESTASRSSN